MSHAGPDVQSLEHAIGLEQKRREVGWQVQEPYVAGMDVLHGVTHGATETKESKQSSSKDKKCVQRRSDTER